MKKIVIRDNNDGSKIKTLRVDGDRSFKFGMEGSRFVVRDLNSGEIIRSIRRPRPDVSISYKVEA
ncbi:MAG: hypothetical protein Pg6C_17260 [Treponemataceae bacterium]|nr:MAG: hypothetical protein Pg6C_17260 [Treponemataceae bacterium]